MGVKKEIQLIVLADRARWISQLAETQYPRARLRLDWSQLKKRVEETANWLKHHGLGRKDVTNWGRQLPDWLWRRKTVAALQSGPSLGQIGSNQLAVVLSVLEKQPGLNGWLPDIPSKGGFYRFGHG